MFLSRLSINRSRAALNWMGNPYRVHQRLCMACEGDPRLLFRIEEAEAETYILVQTQQPPNWPAAFMGVAFLNAPPETKSISLDLEDGQLCRFRLLANPIVKREGKRLGILKEEGQRAWLERKLVDAGAALRGCRIIDKGLQKSEKNPAKDTAAQVHLAVLFEGVLEVTDSQELLSAITAGIGPAKGFGFGLLSLARAAD